MSESPTMSPTVPNIILLMAEDTGIHQGCYGESYAYTPNIDRLAQQGRRYTQYLSVAPVCAPARSCHVTGMYPWALGTHQMRSKLLNPPQLYTNALQQRGYYVNWQNKTDFNFTPPADFATETNCWLERLRTGTLPQQPFFLYRNFEVTHESTMWAQPREGEHWGMAQTRRELMWMVPEAARHDPQHAPVPPYLPNTPEVREDIARYFDALTIQDAQIGAVLAALEQSPYAANTVVIYMADHGRGLVREKRWCYHAGLNVPLIVRWPGHIQAGTVCTDVVSGVDIAPTMLSLAGVTAEQMPRHYQGQAFLGSAQPRTPRAIAFSGRDRMDEAFDRVRTARSSQFHYIRNYFPNIPYCQRNQYMENQLTTQVMRELHATGKLEGAAGLWMRRPKPAEELYDVQRDPHMIHNLAADPTQHAALAQLRHALDEHVQAVDDHGTRSERELIARGLVEDQLDAYRARIDHLPEPYRLGAVDAILESSEADQFTPNWP